MSLEDYINRLPNDVIKKIMSCLDIDSRRALGIIRKIKIPSQFTKHLSSIINNKIEHYSNTCILNSYINLNSIYVIRHQTNTEFNYTTYYVEHTVYKKKNETDMIAISLQLPDIYFSKKLFFFKYF